MRAALALIFVLGLAAPVVAQQQGLEAWARIGDVVTHPRCTNCHVGASGRPGWDGLGYGTPRDHGMNIVAGESRVGAETLPCRVCHISAEGANAVPHAAPQVADAWRLPPVALAWRGKTAAEICAQLRSPAQTGGFDLPALIAHLRQSAFVRYGFMPGGARSPAPRSVQALVRDVALWGAAGMPCPGD